jgi:uncharacterized protein YbjT (DUF2867 family)
MYAVIGATGNTGRVVAEDLLAAGLPVRVVGREEMRSAWLRWWRKEPRPRSVTCPMPNS